MDPGRGSTDGIIRDIITLMTEMSEPMNETKKRLGVCPVKSEAILRFALNGLAERGAMEGLPEERYLHVADIHSHNRMEARFSQLDDANEQATRLYIVLGRLERFYPSICARVSCGGTFLEIDPFSVMESIGEAFPNVWLYRVERKQEDCQKLHCVLVPEGLEEGAS